MRPRLAVLGCIAALLALPAVSSAATKTVYGGGPTKFANGLGNKYGVTVDDWFLRTVTIHVGDSVKFTNLAQGFHVIEIGGNSPLITPQGGTVANKRDAAGALFWFNGLPNVGFNPALITASSNHTFTGHNRVSSAVPAVQNAPNSFTIRFAKVGSFKFHCAVHNGMTGRVNVLPRRSHIPSARDDARALAKQEQADLAAAKRAARPHVPARTVYVGSASSNGVEALSFFPHKLSVPVGTTVRFTMTRGSREFHTATTTQVPFTGTGHSVSNAYLDPISFSPPPLLDPLLAYPSDPPGAAALLTPTLHGNGFWNSGGLDQDRATSPPSSNVVKFNAPGTYNFVCLIHYPFMHGTVVVS